MLGQVIKRARGLLFYRASETFKEDGILRRWKVSRIQTTVSEDLSFPGSGPIVLHRSFGTCALVIIPPLNYRDTSDRVTLLVLTISEDIIFLRRRYKLFRLVPVNLYAWKKYGSESDVA